MPAAQPMNPSRRNALLWLPRREAPLVPDVMLDFETGAGIPLELGGIGGPGSELVQATTPQSGVGFYKRVAKAYDPAWQGYPLFDLKPANQLVGWPGPRAGGYWTGPMSALSSVSETVSGYNSTTDLAVTPVAGGAVGPDAIRCDVAAGQSGGGLAFSPKPTMTSGWYVGSSGTIVYAHAVVEIFSDPAIFEPRVGLRDEGAGTFIETTTQSLAAADGPRSGKVHRGTGPHGGQLYEWWGIARLLTTPTGPLAGYLYLLNAPAASGFPARTIIVHGVQVYFVPRLDTWPIHGVPPFFSYARGAPVVWTAENLNINGVTGAYSLGLRGRITAYDTLGLALTYARLFSRNNNANESVYTTSASALASWTPSFTVPGLADRAVVAVDAGYGRRATVDGVAVVVGSAFSTPAPAPQYISLGRPDDYFYGRFHKAALWRRSLTDAEMLQAFGGL
jgi:hypothetical protein